MRQRSSQPADGSSSRSLLFCVKTCRSILAFGVLALALALALLALASPFAGDCGGFSSEVVFPVPFASAFALALTFALAFASALAFAFASARRPFLRQNTVQTNIPQHVNPKNMYKWKFPKMVPPNHPF